MTSAPTAATTPGRSAVSRSARVRGLAAAASVLAVVLATVLAPSSARAGGGGSISYYYNASNKTFYATPAGYGGGGSDGPPYVYGYVPNCWSNGNPDSGDDALCTGFTAICDARGIADGSAFVVWRRLAGQPWDRQGVVCLTPDQPATITLAEVIRDVREKLRRELIAPAAHANPASPSSQFVALPVIVWADGPLDIDPLQITTPVPFTVMAKADYSWSFGDGTAEIGIGRAYDGTDPIAFPAYYVSHAYDRPGTYAVTVTQTWTVQIFATPGSGAPDTADLQAVAPPATAVQDVTVVESNAVNVAPAAR